MRVLHVYQDFHPARGGIEDVLIELARQLSGASEQIVLTASRSARTTVEQLQGVRVIRAASFGRFYTPFCPSWPGWIDRLAADVVHVHLPCPMAELAALLARPRRLVVSVHNDYISPRPLVAGWTSVHQAALRRACRVVVSTRAYADTSPAVRAGAAGRLAIIPYGVRLSEYAPRPPSADALRRRHGRLVVFLGRLCYYKGVEVLLEAAPAVPATILIIGDGPWRRRLEARAAGLPNVRFTGALPEAEAVAYLHAAEVFVLPSTRRAEAFGIAQLKAMACALPVVSSDLPGVAWVNQDQATGLTVPARDPPALAGAIHRLLREPELRARLARGARRRAQQFPVERMGADHLALYAACTARGDWGAAIARLEEWRRDAG